MTEVQRWLTMSGQVRLLILDDQGDLLDPQPTQGEIHNLMEGRLRDDHLGLRTLWGTPQCEQTEPVWLTDQARAEWGAPGRWSGRGSGKTATIWASLGGCETPPP